MAVLKVENISKKFGKNVIFHDVTFSVEKGDLIVIIGPSGTGKSTLLRLLLGLVEPDAGHVCFRGQEMTGANVLTLRHQIGYVIQDGGLFPHLTARQNVTLLASHLHWS